jgi:hypothetical protein
MIWATVIEGAYIRVLPRRNVPACFDKEKLSSLSFMPIKPFDLVDDLADMRISFVKAMPIWPTSHVV